MKRLKQHWSARPISWLLSVAMIWPLLLFVLSSVPVQAQTNGTPTWAVLDFENRSGYGGAEVGRAASDAFVVELGKSNKYEVLSRQETEKGIADTGLTPPLDGIGLQRLGRGLGVPAVATGEVAAISFSRSPRQATASVIIRVIDTSTGELVNGALAQGRSNPRAIGTNDDDALVNEAINNAAFAAVRQITQFNLPKATVLISRDQNSVVLNRGTRDGLFNGLNMVVTRNNSEVGRIQVSDAQADQSTASVTRRGLGIQPQDRATAVYQLPAYTVQGGVLNARNNDVASDGASSSGKRSIFSGVTGIILAILAGALLFSLIKRGSSSGSLGGAEVGKPVAVEGRADVLGGQGAFPVQTSFVGIITTTSTTIPPGLIPQPTPLIYTPIVVKVTATTGNISITNFQEFHVYRSDFPPVLQSVGTVTGTTGGTTGAFVGYGQVPIFASSGRNSLLFLDDGADKLTVTASKPLSGIVGGSNGGGNTGNTNGLQTIGPTGYLVGTGIPSVGAHLQYFIEGLYVQPATNGGSPQNPGAPGNTGTSSTGGNGGTSGTSGNTSGNTTGNTGHASTFQLTGRTPTNFITYVEPVYLSTTGDPVAAMNTGLTGYNAFSVSTGPDNIVINVHSTPAVGSGLEYVLELADNLGFTNKKVLTPQQTGGSTGPYLGALESAPQTSGPLVTWFLRNNGSNQDYRVNTLFSGFSTGRQVFARIGTRDPQNGSSQDTNPFIYSDPVQVPTNG